MKSKTNKIDALLSGDIKKIAHATGKPSKFLPISERVFIAQANGLYSGREYENLTKEEIEERTTGVIFILPDNGRQ